jgi:hypothetical protein
MWRIGYEVNRSQKQTNSVGNSTEIAELIVAQRYTVGYKLYKTTALHKKSETSGDIEFFHRKPMACEMIFVPLVNSTE